MVPEESALGHSSQDRPPPGWPLASTPYRPRVTPPGNTGRLPEASRLPRRGRWLKKKYKHMSPAGAQPPVWIDRSGSPSSGPACDSKGLFCQLPPLEHKLLKDRAVSSSCFLSPVPRITAWVLTERIRDAGKGSSVCSAPTGHRDHG